MKIVMGCLLLVSWIVAASDHAFSAPSRGCTQTQDKCVADRVATGSRADKAQVRCAELLAKCKKK